MPFWIYKAIWSTQSHLFTHLQTIFTKIHSVKKTNSNKSNNFTSLNMCFLLSYSLSKRLHANPPGSDFPIDVQHEVEDLTSVI